MPSDIYKALFTAILKKQPVRFIGKSRPRQACPHVLGWTKGAEVVFVFQTGGESESRTPLPGWRCFKLAEIGQLEEADGPWRSGTSHKRSQACVADVDIDINPKAKQRHVWTGSGVTGAVKKPGSGKQKPDRTKGRK